MRSVDAWEQKQLLLAKINGATEKCAQLSSILKRDLVSVFLI